MELLLAVLAITFCLFFLSLHKKSNKQKPTSKNLPPEAGGGLPLFGHLFKLSGPDPLHITLSNMADKYGSVFSIRLGNRRAVIVNNCETAKECFRTNDLVFSNRLRTAAVGLMGYNFAMLGFSDYGPYWREMRKIVVLSLLSNRKVAALGGVRGVQIQAQMRSINEQIKKVPTVEMRKVFGDLTLSLMLRTVAGDVESKMDLQERDKLRQSIREFFKIVSVITISDVLPFLKRVDYFGGMHKAFRKTGGDLYSVLEEWLQEHKEQKKTMGDNEEEDDFMAEMLRLLDSVAQEFPNYDADTMNKATCLTMILGGSDTISVSLIWALSLLLNNPHTLKKAQQELDIHIGRQRQVQESDIENLLYIKAILKETLRLHPPVPVIPRRAGQDCTVAGHHIPAETFLFINAWKIQRDPNVWPHPLEFKPERFLTDIMEKDIVDHDQVELLTFGVGRRICPGISFAFQAMQLTLASFLHGFDVETAGGEAVDMTGSFGTTNMKAMPLEVCLRPRLSPELYA